MKNYLHVNNGMDMPCGQSINGECRIATAIHSSVVDSLCTAQLIKVAPNLILAVLPLMKAIPALGILTKALAEGTVKPGGRVIDSSSGGFALGLAFACKKLNLSLTVVGDAGMDSAAQDMLTNLGARLEIVSTPLDGTGIQVARINRVREIMHAEPGTFFTSQYSNPHNPVSYECLARQIVKSLGDVDCIVGSVGTGGSMTGTVRGLNALGNFPKVIGVDTFGSVLFGQEDRKRLVRGLGNSLIPGNLDHTLFNQVHWIPFHEAARATQELFAAHGLFVGPTTGCAHKVASWWAKQNPTKLCVAISPDGGERYRQTFHSKVWIDQNLSNRGMTYLDTPRTLNHPRQGGEEWSVFDWNNRSLEEVSLGN